MGSGSIVNPPATLSDVLKVMRTIRGSVVAVPDCASYITPYDADTAAGPHTTSADENTNAASPAHAQVTDPSVTVCPTTVGNDGADDPDVPPTTARYRLPLPVAGLTNTPYPYAVVAAQDVLHELAAVRDSDVLVSVAPPAV
jgi:hypothetical protein